MKYGDNNPITRCIMTHSRCFVRGDRIQVRGILWHDTGAGSPDISRYVQPTGSGNDGWKEPEFGKDPNYDELLEVLGKNKYNNHWNQSDTRDTGVHLFIGKLANGEISTVQALPFNYRCWGAGSYKFNNIQYSVNGGWIQFEICEDSWSESKGKYIKADPKHFAKCYIEACEVTAYLCKKFDIDPKGYVDHPVTSTNIKIPTILCHHDAGTSFKIGNDHSDVYEYFKLYISNFNMEMVRNHVQDLLDGKQISITVDGITYTSTTESGGNITKGFDTEDKDYSYRTPTDDYKAMYKTDDGRYRLYLTSFRPDLYVEEDPKLWSDSTNDYPEGYSDTDYEEEVDNRLRSPFNFSSYLTKPYGKYKNDDRYHNGEDYVVFVQNDMDIGVGGWRVYAIDDGEITDKGYEMSKRGYYLKYKISNDYEITYSHLDGEPEVDIGNKVESGDYLGLAGNSGNSIGRHLHIEVKNEKLEYVKPSDYIRLG